MTDERADLLTAATALIVSAYVKNSHVATADLAALIGTVHSALGETGDPVPAPPQQPAVALRRLVTADRLYCAECGKAFKSLKGHLMSSHHLSPSAYVAKWGLKKDHPMVAPSYSASRSAMALSFWFGRKGAGKAAGSLESGSVSTADAEAEAATRSAGTSGKNKSAAKGKRAAATSKGWPGPRGRPGAERASRDKRLGSRRHLPGEVNACARDDPWLRAKRHFNLRGGFDGLDGYAYRSEPPFGDVMAASYPAPPRSRSPVRERAISPATWPILPPCAVSHPLRRRGAFLDRPPPPGCDLLASRRHRKELGPPSASARLGDVASAPAAGALRPPFGLPEHGRIQARGAIRHRGPLRTARRRTDGLRQRGVSRGGGKPAGEQRPPPALGG